MKKVKLTFVANKNITNETLHCLYTNVRFKEKKLNADEEFKVWSEGRTAHIIIDEEKIENNNESFVFIDENGSEIKLKLMKKQVFEIAEKLKNTDSVSVFGLISHSRKHYTSVDGKTNEKPISFCVLDLQSRFKKGTKKDFLNYLTNETGLDFFEAEKNNKVIFERVAFDEDSVFSNTLTKKVAIKNVIVINAEEITVIDEDKANALFYKNIGKRKSYGMGSFSVDFNG